MRLFIALNFDSLAKQKLKETQNGLRRYAVKGNFTLEENLHLTLAFLGEVEPEKLSLIETIMDEISAPSFSLVFNGTGSFKRDGGDIWWIGADENAVLSNLQRSLSERLSESGFIIEKRRFIPHLTLGREIILNHSFDPREFVQTVPKIVVPISKIHLMKSERIMGRLTYTPVYKRVLE